MAKVIEIEAWVLVDADEQWVVAASQDELHTRYTEDVGDDTQAPRRTFCITLRVPAPAIVELEAEIPEEPGAGELSIKA